MDTSEGAPLGTQGCQAPCSGLDPGVVSHRNTPRGWDRKREIVGPLSTGSPGPESPTYANLPVSPSGRKQLHYLGLELQEAGVGVRGRCP